MRSGDLFLEVSSSNQATALIKLQKLAHLDLTVAPHSTLNFSRGVISPADFLNVSTEEIKENMKAQKVCDVRRITIRRDGQVLNTKHLILTFLRLTSHRPLKWPTYDAQFDRTSQIRCAAFSANDTATLRTSVGASLPALVAGNRSTTAQIEITAVKIKEKISYPEARRVVLSRTPVSGKSYASATRKSTSDKCIQCDSKKDNISVSSTPTEPEQITISGEKKIQRTESDSPRKPNSRRARQRDLKPHLTRIPKKLSRDFHRKIEDDTLTGDCSEDDNLPLAVPLSDMKRVIMHHIFKIWQESWSQQLDNKLHSVKPVIGAWPVMPMRRTDVKYSLHTQAFVVWRTCS
ncbi:uncharacterized protein TNCV_4817351 [Trichonephila clavipes]|nr:uncharacterized protein TNCV_4817351 [Trichonephila clavipes]